MTKPWLLLPVPLAHALAPWALPIFSFLEEDKTPVWKSLQWRNLNFKNPLGIAGGVDKNAENLKDWWKLGAGFLEVGTITPRPQKANAGQIIDRDLKEHALWNKMGFPNWGSHEIYLNLCLNRPYKTPVFVNIGKNRETSNDQALADYLFLIRKLSVVADVFVINISSPNTTGLRDLQAKKYLFNLISNLKKESSNLLNRPLLLKISPDLTDQEFNETTFTAIEGGIDGFVLTNTTTQRINGINFPTEGGVSGRPLKDLSLKSLKRMKEILNSCHEKLLVVSVGGIDSYQDVCQRLDLGADLIEVYTALIFEGPGFFKKMALDFSNGKKLTYA